MSIPFPPGMDEVSGGRVAVDATAPSVTNVGADTPVPMGQAIEHVLVQNNTVASVWVNFDAAAAVGALVLVASGQLLLLAVPCKTIHLFTAAAQQINSTAAGISVAGWT